jgi:hypothetical protein
MLKMSFLRDFLSLSRQKPEQDLKTGHIHLHILHNSSFKHNLHCWSQFHLIIKSHHICTLSFRRSNNLSLLSLPLSTETHFCHSFLFAHLLTEAVENCSGSASTQVSLSPGVLRCKILILLLFHLSFLHKSTLCKQYLFTDIVYDLS